MKQIKIPAPKALPGETVDVLNYRRRPAAWETGLLLKAEYAGRSWRGEQDVEFAWSYEVSIPREGQVAVGHHGRRRGGNYTIHVGDDAINRRESER